MITYHAKAPNRATWCGLQPQDEDNIIVTDWVKTSCRECLRAGAATSPLAERQLDALEADDKAAAEAAVQAVLLQAQDASLDSAIEEARGQ